MDKRTIERIRRNKPCLNDLTDSDIDEIFTGTLNEATAELSVAADDFLAAIKDALPNWIKHPPKL